jgi:hypothetical protein
VSIPLASAGSDVFCDDLIAHSEALFMSWHQQLREERDRRLKDLHSQNLQVGGRAFRRFEIYGDLLKREVKERIRIYKSVADEYECAELLSQSRLDALRETIMTGVSWSCLTLKDHNDADIRAVGERSSPPEAGRYEALKGRILGVVNAELAVLETEGRLRARVSSLTEKNDRIRPQSPGATPSRSEPHPPVVTTLPVAEPRPARRRAVRQPLVDAFLAACNAEKPAAKIIEKHIWMSAGHKTARQFQHWKHGADQATESDNRNFARVIGMPSAKFIEVLKEKNLI